MNVIPATDARYRYRTRRPHIKEAAMPKSAQEQLQDCDAAASSPGNYDSNPYMYGMANGLRLALGILNSHTPDYLAKPAHWLDKRDNAYAAIDSERAYQNEQRGNAKRHENMPPVMTPGECILTMEKCLADARVAWYSPEGGTACLDHLRKVAAVAVQAMENYGAPFRV